MTKYQRLVALIEHYLLAHPAAWHEDADRYDAAERWLASAVPIEEAERRIAGGEWAGPTAA